MGVSIRYEFPSLYDPHGLISGSQESDKRQHETYQARLLDALTSAREIIEAGIVPSDAEADDFYQTIGSSVDNLDVGRLWRFDKNLFLLRGEFYRQRYLTDHWFEWLINLTPELQKLVQRDLGIHITQIWASQADDKVTLDQWPRSPFDDKATVEKGTEG